ncbi:MAG: preprotein translocase subunit SecE [Betaproteobacteria bacterium]|nr:preprotein translocase subunit SecE [Betaproteobacteria bacterium]
MSEIPNTAYRYALGFYVLFAGFFWYAFHALGQFVAQHYVPQSASGFSVANPKFALWNNTVASLLTVVAVVLMFASRRLKEYVVDVGDELTRVSWADLKETQKATLIVIVLVAVSSVFLFLADFIFVKVIQLIMSQAA